MVKIKAQTMGIRNSRQQQKIKSVVVCKYWYTYACVTYVMGRPAMADADSSLRERSRPKKSAICAEVGGNHVVRVLLLCFLLGLES